MCFTLQRWNNVHSLEYAAIANTVVITCTAERVDRRGLSHFAFKQSTGSVLKSKWLMLLTKSRALSASVYFKETTFNWITKCEEIFFNCYGHYSANVCIHRILLVWRSQSGLFWWAAGKVFSLRSEQILSALVINVSLCHRLVVSNLLTWKKISVRVKVKFSRFFFRILEGNCFCV